MISARRESSNSVTQNAHDKWDDQRAQGIIVSPTEVSIDLDRNAAFPATKGSETPRETEKPFWVGMVFKGGHLTLPPAFVRARDPNKTIDFKLAEGEMIYDLNGFNYQTFLYNEEGVPASFGDQLGGFTDVTVFNCLLDMYANKVNLEIDAEVAQAQWGGPLLSDRDIYFQISVSSAAEDTLRFNLAEAVFGVAAGKTFNSDDLGVRVSDSADAVVADTAVQYKAGTIGDPTLAVSDPADINSVLGELEQGHYTLEISTTGDGTNAAITARLRDAQGQLVTISATGEAGGGGDIGTVMNATSTGATAALHLGSGVTIDLTGLDVTNGQAATVTVGFDYVRGGSTLDDNSAARAFMDKVDVAAEKVAGAMSYIGSVVNRLEYQESSLSVAKVNTEAAYNRIMNADMAFEQIEATKYMILQQTSVAMLAQANMSPQAIMGLFR